jgi:hypothetical protein
MLIGAAAVIFAMLFAGKAAAKMPDLEVYWKAAVRARAAEPLYRAEDLHYQFKYLPAFAVLTIPLGLVSLPIAKAIWFAISVALLAALVALSLATLPERRKPAWLLVSVTIVAMSKFYGHEMVLGQMNLLLGILALLAVRAIQRGREVQAGVLVALAVVAKPYAAIFLPWLAARRRGASVLAVTIGLALVLALPSLRYGVAGNVELHRAWWRTVTESTAPNLTNQDNVSIAAMYAKWMGQGSTAIALSAATSTALLALLAFVFVRRGGLRHPDGLEGSLLLTSIPLLSPQGWDYVFLVSTPAIMYLVNYEDRLPAPVRAVSMIAIAVIGLSLFDVMGRGAYAAFMSLSIITVCYAVVIAALSTLRMRGIA